MKSYTKKEISYIVGLVNDKKSFIKIDNLIFSNIEEAQNHFINILNNPISYKIPLHLIANLDIFELQSITKEKITPLRIKENI